MEKYANLWKNALALSDVAIGAGVPVAAAGVYGAGKALNDKWNDFKKQKDDLSSEINTLKYKTLPISLAAALAGSGIGGYLGGKAGAPSIPDMRDGLGFNTPVQAFNQEQRPDISALLAAMQQKQGDANPYINALLQKQANTFLNSLMAGSALAVPTYFGANKLMNKAIDNTDMINNPIQELYDNNDLLQTINKYGPLAGLVGGGVMGGIGGYVGQKYGQ